MKCEVPIATGISMYGNATYDKCGRDLHLDTGLCFEHAVQAGKCKRKAPRADRTAHGRRLMATKDCVICGTPFHPWAQRPGSTCDRSCAAKLNMKRRIEKRAKEAGND